MFRRSQPKAKAAPAAAATPAPAGGPAGGSATARAEQERADAELARRIEQEGEDEQMAWALSENLNGGNVHGAGPGPILSGGPSGLNNFIRPAPVFVDPSLLSQNGGFAHQPTVYVVPGGRSPGGQIGGPGGASMMMPPVVGGGNGSVPPGSGPSSAASGHGMHQMPPTSPSRGSNIQPQVTSDEMVHVACEIGNIAVEMMVDTGAQSSVISRPLMDQLQLRPKLNQMRSGVAAGVGTAKIIGTLEQVPVTLGHVEFALDFAVLDVSEPLLMLGIDQMRRFKCIIDLERNVMVFGGGGGVEVPFLVSSGGMVGSRRGMAEALGDQCGQM